MKFLKSHLPSMLLVIFEVVVGILLLIDPISFTQTVLFCFGVVLLLIGAFYLFRYLRDRSSGQATALTLLWAVLALAVGCVGTFATEWLMGIFLIIAILYGLIMIISGILKAQSWFDARKAGLPVSPLVLMAATASVVLGAVVAFNPFRSATTLWRFAGISLILLALVDSASVALAARLDAETVVVETTELDNLR